MSRSKRQRTFSRSIRQDKFTRMWKCYEDGKRVTEYCHEKDAIEWLWEPLGTARNPIDNYMGNT